MKKVYLIAVLFALIAGFATYMFASEIDKKSTIKDADTVTVFVPVADIEANTSITEDMFAEDAGVFATKTVIAEDKAPNAVTSKEELLDMVTIDTLYAGEQINSKRLESIDGEDVALSLKLAKGKVAYSFDAPSVTSVDGYISEGDTVDVLIYEDEEGKEKSEIAYKGLKILRVSTNSDNSKASKNGSAITEYSTLTVEVTKEQALELYDIENTYSYKLILNPRD
ncbi:MAG: Flp pilus assembly protein CpaB [Eubacteriales bacterium]|nr:Flp pilus assembly protein CpaB [Eubacteriales bacterium]